MKQSTERFIIVQSTKQLIEQTALNLSDISCTITSDYSNNVSNEVVEFLKKPKQRILILSEKAFLTILDITLLENWHIILDDVVEFHTYRQINTEKKYMVEHELFTDFEDISSHYVTAKPITDFDDDLVRAGASEFSFLKQNDHFIMNSSFFEKSGKIGDHDVYNNKCNQLTTTAWVNIEKYKNLNITFMANRFTNTLIYRANPSLFEETTLPGLRKRTVPVNDRLKVYYFSKQRFTRALRSKNPDALQKAVAWINQNVKKKYFYTTNTSTGKILNGDYIKPVSRGMNTYQDYTTCVWLASMKPSPVESKQLELMFGLSREQIIQARELENIYQFVNRSNLRDYSSEQVIEVYVFDEEQARSLSTNIQYIDVGIDDECEQYVPLALNNTKKQRLKRIKQKKLSSEEFEAWLTSSTNDDLSSREREHFRNKCLPK